MPTENPTPSKSTHTPGSLGNLEKPTARRMPSSVGSQPVSAERLRTALTTLRTRETSTPDAIIDAVIAHASLFEGLSPEVREILKRHATFHAISENEEFLSPETVEKKRQTPPGASYSDRFKKWNFEIRTA